ncbi:cleavage and polyadenylation specificity factor subunit 3 [Sarotherodon galilaeus]
MGRLLRADSERRGLFHHLLRRRSYLSSFFLSPLTLKQREDIKGNLLLLQNSVTTAFDSTQRSGSSNCGLADTNTKGAILDE